MAAARPADLAVVIAPDGPAGRRRPRTRPPRDAYVNLVSALDEDGSGAVLASNVGVDRRPRTASVVTELRQDADGVKTVSTVDDAGLPMGRASIVFALTQQLDGQAGQYGLRAV